jgi:hypothetical protein
VLLKSHQICLKGDVSVPAAFNLAIRPFCSVTIRRASSMRRPIVLRRSSCIVMSSDLAAFGYFTEILSLGPATSGFFVPPNLAAQSKHHRGSPNLSVSFRVT